MVMWLLNACSAPIPMVPRHAGYVADWIRLLKEDDRAIFTAASKASQAADFLRQFSEAAKSPNS